MQAQRQAEAKKDAPNWNDASDFDADKDKRIFRQYVRVPVP